MPPLAQRRLAGFRFEVQPPPLPEKLPRMDIAVFVGFAAAGPLDLPVVIEDVARFQQLFGDDLPLAWDARHRRMIYAHLGPAVRAFFRNGGRRCWVIRVAGEPEADFFPLPGMLELADNELRPSFARARSPGSWFDTLQCATALTVMPVSVTDARSPEEFVARLPTGTELQSGDLVRLKLISHKLQFFVFVRKVGPVPESPPDPRSHSFLIEGEVKACFEEASPQAVDQRQCDVTWTRLPQNGESPAIEAKVKNALLVGNLTSPPDALPPGLLRLLIPNNPSPPGTAFSPPPGSLLKVEARGDVLWFRVASVGRAEQLADSAFESVTFVLGRGFWLRDAKTPLPAGALPVAEKLTFELRARRGDRDAVRLTDLGFAWDNARCWTALLDDRAMFDPHGPFSKPLTSLDRLHDDLRREAAEHPLDGARFPVAGTGDTQTVFLPLLVQPLPDEFLPPEHSDNDELTRDGLNDFRSSLFLDNELIETFASSLLGEADFIRYQQRNPRRLRGIHAALEVEEATLIAVPDAVHVGWNLAAREATPPPRQSDLLPHPCWGLSEGCGYESKLATGERPRYEKFLNCSVHEIPKPRLHLQQEPDALGNFTIAWVSAESGVSFILEEATRPDLSDARELYRGNNLQRTLYGRRPGNYYYRVRAEAGCETSNWSNEIPVTVRPPNRYELHQVGERKAHSPTVDFESGPLLDIHRSLLRLCAARGDLFAVLALPEHFGAEASLNHLRLLKPPERGAPTVIGSTPAIGQGENNVFSFGAVYHPWLLTRDGDDEPLHSPPDGAAVGIIARRSLERGAWIAPANEIFRGVIALNPALADGRRLDLLLAQINQLTQEPEGFLALNADTLSLDSELRPINVRRLLILLRRAALKRGAYYVFEPNGPALRRLVQHAFEDLLNQLFVRGAFAGETRATSYEVVTDDSINPPQNMELGRFRVDLKVAPSVPMSFVTVRLVQTGERGVATELF